MNETIGAKHLPAVDRMFEVARTLAEGAKDRLAEDGHISPEMLHALELYLDISLDRESDPDASNRYHLAATETLGSNIGDTLSRARAVRIGNRIAILALRTARRAALSEDIFDLQD